MEAENGRGEMAAGAGSARSRILDAAEPLFQQNGFARTTMDAIAAQARMSKRTLYAEFADKRTILETVLDRFITGRFETIADLSRDSLDDHAALVVIAQGLGSAAVDAPAMAMYRLLIGEAQHLPALAEKANRHGLFQSLQMMHGPLDRLGVVDHTTAGRMIYDLVVLAPLHRRLMDLHDADIPAQDVIDVVLAGFARR
jgi:TetR/AcrR family transcriptional repressor of mexJK operon